MTRKEFMEAYVRLVGEARVKNYPDMRLSERVASSQNDIRNAARYWRQHGKAFQAVSLAEWEQRMREKLFEERS